MHITHYDFSVVAADLPSSLQLQTKKHSFTAQSIEAFTDTFASAYDLALPFVKQGYQPKDRLLSTHSHAGDTLSWVLSLSYSGVR